MMPAWSFTNVMFRIEKFRSLKDKSHYMYVLDFIALSSWKLDSTCVSLWAFDFQPTSEDILHATLIRWRVYFIIIYSACAHTCAWMRVLIFEQDTRLMSIIILAVFIWLKFCRLIHYRFFVHYYMILPEPELEAIKFTHYDDYLNELSFLTAPSKFLARLRHGSILIFHVTLHGQQRILSYFLFFAAMNL